LINTQELTHSQSVEKVLDLLDALIKLKLEIPPVENALSRFGNPAFVTFYDKAAEVIGTPYPLAC
jgi:serine/threonine-protein phosphatase 2A activator